MTASSFFIVVEKDVVPGHASKKERLDGTPDPQEWHAQH
jgi:hypothetical protein